MACWEVCGLASMLHCTPFRVRHSRVVVQLCSSSRSCRASLEPPHGIMFSLGPQVKIEQLPSTSRHVRHFELKKVPFLSPRGKEREQLRQLHSPCAVASHPFLSRACLSMWDVGVGFASWPRHVRRFTSVDFEVFPGRVRDELRTVRRFSNHSF